MQRPISFVPSTGAPTNVRHQHQRRTSKTAFLRKRGNVWYAAVPVPRSLRQHFGDVRLVRSLETDSLAVAHEARWSVIAELKARISAARRLAAGLPPSLLDEAKRLRAAILSGEPGGDDALLLAVESRLESIALRHGESQAIEVAQLAHGAKTLEEAAVPWIASSDKESTRAQRRSVVDVLAATMKRRTTEILAEKISKADALAAVEAWEGEGPRIVHHREPLRRVGCVVGLADVPRGGAEVEESKTATRFTAREEDAKTKSSQRRVCVTGPAARKLLRAWVAMEKLDRASMSGGVRRYLDARGLGDDVDFHSCRRTFTNQAERAGADPLAVMRFTQHKPGGMSFSLYCLVPSSLPVSCPCSLR